MSFWRKILVSMKSQSRNSLPRTSGTSPPCRHSAKGHGIDMVSWSDNVGLTTHRVANVPGQIIRMNARKKNEAFLFGCVLQISAFVWTWSLLDSNVVFLQHWSLPLYAWFELRVFRNEHCFRSMIKFQLPFLFLGISKPKRRKIINLPYQGGTQFHLLACHTEDKEVLPTGTKSVMGCHGAYLWMNWIETEISWYLLNF